MKRFLAFVLTVVIIALSLSACKSDNNSDSDKLTLYVLENQWGGMGNSAIYYVYNRKASEKDKIELVAFESVQAMKDKLSSELMAGKGPDIILDETLMMTGLGVQKLIEADSFLDLNELNMDLSSYRQNTMNGSDKQFRDKLFFIYIILLILPLQVTIVPDYIILDNLGLLNNFLAVILPGTFSAFGICLLRQSMKYISDSSIEAARIDGASYFKVFLRIILPQIKGGLITLTLLCFIDNWNMVEQPLIYFDDKAMYPLSITMADVSSGDLGIVFACGVMFMIPALLIYLYGHRDIDSPFVNTDK